MSICIECLFTPRRAIGPWFSFPPSLPSRLPLAAAQALRCWLASLDGDTGAWGDGSVDNATPRGLRYLECRDGGACGKSSRRYASHCFLPFANKTTLCSIVC
jgi:hypothetical protein